MPAEQTNIAGQEKRFVATNMMQAMRKLTEEFGADAILLSSRSVEQGVEVIGLPPGAKPSLTDYSGLHTDRRQGERRSRGRRASDQLTGIEGSQSSVSLSPDSGGIQENEQQKDEVDSKDVKKAIGKHSLKESLAGINLRQTAADLARQIEALNSRAHKKIDSETQNAQESTATSLADTENHIDDSLTSDVTPSVAEMPDFASDEAGSGSERDNRLQAIVDEKLTAMQRMLEQSLASRSQEPSTLLPPREYIVSNRLHELRFPQKLVTRLLSMAVPIAERGSLPVDEIWRRVLCELRDLMPVWQTDLIEAGGVYAFTGPAGSGKTSMLLKLMAQAALCGRASEVAVLTFDGAKSGVSSSRLQRLASVSQITVLPVLANRAGGSQGTPLESEEAIQNGGQVDNFSLQARIAQCNDKRLVLIDTDSIDGASHRSGYFRALEELECASSVKEIVCLSATADAAYQRTVLKAYSNQRSVACTLTRCDEAGFSGELFAALIESQLPLAYLSQGDALPGQLVKPDIDSIISRLCQNDGGSNELLDEVTIPVLHKSVANKPVMNTSAGGRPDSNTVDSEASGFDMSSMRTHAVDKPIVNMPAEELS